MIRVQLGVLTIASLMVFVGVGIAWVIYRDSLQRGVSDFIATVWAIGVFLLAPVILPLYLLMVVRSQKRTSPFRDSELWLIWLFCSLYFPLLLGAVLLPPDPFTQLSLQVVIVPLFSLVMYLLVFKLFSPSTGHPS